jgi:hypothetical protein
LLSLLRLLFSSRSVLRCVSRSRRHAPVTGNVNDTCLAGSVSF